MIVRPTNFSCNFSLLFSVTIYTPTFFRPLTVIYRILWNIRAWLGFPLVLRNSNIAKLSTTDYHQGSRC